MDKEKNILEQLKSWAEGKTSLYLTVMENIISDEKKEYITGRETNLHFTKNTLGRGLMNDDFFKKLFADFVVRTSHEDLEAFSFPEVFCVYRAEPLSFPNLVNAIIPGSCGDRGKSMSADEIKDLVTEVLLKKKELLIPVELHFAKFLDVKYREQLLLALHSLVNRINAIGGFKESFTFGCFPMEMVKQVSKIMSCMVKITNGLFSTDLGGVRASSLRTEDLDVIYGTLRNIYKKLFFKELVVVDGTNVCYPKKKTYEVRVEKISNFNLIVDAINEQDALEKAKLHLQDEEEFEKNFPIKPKGIIPISTVYNLTTSNWSIKGVGGDNDETAEQ